MTTLFHEFGHVMHELLTRSKYSPLSGTSVPTDFVEAPSQMLEYWTWDKAVLDTFAADYRDPTKKIPEDVMARLLDSQPDAAISTRGGLACDLTDLALHTEISTNNAKDAVALANRMMEEVFFAEPRRTAWVASFNRLATGYDASYYGYDWAEAIATDMATKFQKARDGYLDVKTGRRLRREIYEQGNSRDVELSVRKFLGRKVSFKAYFEGLAPKESDEEEKKCPRPILRVPLPCPSLLRRGARPLFLGADEFENGVGAVAGDDEGHADAHVEDLVVVRVRGRGLWSRMISKMGSMSRAVAFADEDVAAFGEDAGDVVHEAAAGDVGDAFDECGVAGVWSAELLKRLSNF